MLLSALATRAISVVSRAWSGSAAANPALGIPADPGLQADRRLAGLSCQHLLDGGRIQRAVPVLQPGLQPGTSLVAQSRACDRHLLLAGRPGARAVHADGASDRV